MGSLSAENQYTLQSESLRIFELIVNNPSLRVPGEVKKLSNTVQFVGDETEPFFPVPHKVAEAQAGLLGYVGLLANTISKERYGIEQTVLVDW